MRTLLTATVTALCLLTTTLSAQLQMSVSVINQGGYAVEALDDGIYLQVTISQAVAEDIQFDISWRSSTATVGSDFASTGEYSFDGVNFFTGNNPVLPAGFVSMIIVTDILEHNSYNGEGVESLLITVTAINAPIQNPIVTRSCSIFDFLDPNNDGSKSIGDFDLVLNLLGLPATGWRWIDFNQNNIIDLGDLIGMISVPSPGYNTRMGDANFDGKVDAMDLNILGINWQTSGNNWADADFDGDGFVGTSDLNYIAVNWGFGT